MKAFRRRGGVYIGTFRPEEARMISQLAEQIAELMSTHADFDDDPAVDRLLPDAYRDDDEAAAEFRRFTADGLAQRKIVNARVVIAALEEAVAAVAPTRVTVDPAGAQAWIRTITDIRLSIAARLGIESDDGQLPRGEPLVEIYVWLAFVQESLVRVLK